MDEVNNWYVIRTKPRCERHVLALLKRAGYKGFLPEIETVSSSAPLFPSYLFLCANLYDPAHHRLVRYTRGIRHILGDESGPLPIASEIIEELIQNTKDGLLNVQQLLFREGEVVRVKHGILKDLVGMVESHLSPDRRVEILFKWWSTTMRVKLPYTWLEKAS